MHDFCFTIPYGLLLVCGGLSAYITKGSVASLAGGAGSGLLLIIAGYLSLNAFGKRKNSYLALVLETGMFYFSTFRYCYVVLLFWFGDVWLRRVDSWLVLDSGSETSSVLEFVI